MSSDGGGPLSGYEVVEVCSAIGGPFVGKHFADSGANVTKVGPLAGSTYRNRPLGYDTHDSDDMVYRFLPYNTRKDSIAVDLKSEGGAEILWELIEEADVLVENMRSGSMERLGFEWERMHERNPGLIYCSITGYGDDGPYRDWPAMDFGPSPGGPTRSAEARTPRRWMSSLSITPPRCMRSSES